MIPNDKMHLFCFVVLFPFRVSFYGMQFGIKYDIEFAGIADLIKIPFKKIEVKLTNIYILKSFLIPSMNC